MVLSGSGWDDVLMTAGDAHRRRPEARGSAEAARSSGWPARSWAVLACLTFLTAACGSSGTTAGSVRSVTSTTTGPAAPSVSSVAPSAATDAQVTKLLVLVIENRSYQQMTTQMPYVFGLAQTYGYATDFRAIRHPSLPNYLAIAGGSTFDVTDDKSPSDHPIAGASAFGDAVRGGKTAKIYNEGMPANCALESGGDRYAVKHNAWAYFADERDLCQKYSVPLTGLDQDIAAGSLPNAGQIIPNLCHDAHDPIPGCSLGEADQWTQQVIEKILAGPDFRSGHLAVVVTADEDDRHADNQILTTVFHPSQHANVVSTPLTSYSLSRLFSQVLGTTPLKEAASAPNMAKAFTLPLAAP